MSDGDDLLSVDMQQNDGESGTNSRKRKTKGM